MFLLRWWLRWNERECRERERSLQENIYGVNDVKLRLTQPMCPVLGEICTCLIEANTAPAFKFIIFCLRRDGESVAKRRGPPFRKPSGFPSMWHALQRRRSAWLCGTHLACVVERASRTSQAFFRMQPVGCGEVGLTTPRAGCGCSHV
jgi:hypothetical protein